MSFLAFVIDRTSRGRMEAASLGRANRLVRTMPNALRLEIAATGPAFHRPPEGLPLTCSQVSWAVACTMVNLVHRHHSAPVGHKFSFGVFAGSDLVGVAICGRPVARMLDDGKTLEVTRTATVGYKNSISKVLAAARKEALAHGFTRLITYTLGCESGASLKASGFTCMGPSGGGSWSRGSRPRADNHPTEEKLRWEWRAPNQRTFMKITNKGRRDH